MIVTGLRPAGFWIRTAALVIDGAVVLLAQFSLGLAAGLLWGAGVEESWEFRTSVLLFTLLFAGAYSVALHALHGRTLGKALLGVRVVLEDGAPLTVGVALLRWLAGWASLIPFGLGFLMAGMRADKRALHDLLAGTRVVRTRDAASPAIGIPHPTR
jgi:uncharacterized RDD family membrane protein YckC